jgi:hypothetical protein
MLPVGRSSLGCLSLCVPACLPACLSVCLSASACSPACRSPSDWLSACLPVCLPARLSVCLYLCSPSDFRPVYLSLSLSAVRLSAGLPVSPTAAVGGRVGRGGWRWVHSLTCSNGLPSLSGCARPISNLLPLRIPGTALRIEKGLMSCAHTRGQNPHVHVRTQTHTCTHMHVRVHAREVGGKSRATLARPSSRSRDRTND